MSTMSTEHKLHFNTKNVYLTLFENFVTNEEEAWSLMNRLAQNNNKKIEYWVIGAIENDEENKQPHQHAYIKGKYPLEFNSKPYIKLGRDKTTRIHYVPCNEYSTRTGDISKIVSYIKKKGVVSEHGTIVEEPYKVAWSTAINMAMNMTTWDEADEFLMQNNSEKYIVQEAKIQQKWYTLHKREKDIERINEKEYNEWDYERNPELKVIKRWVGIAATNKNKRMPMLIVVGPTKTGKTSFMEKELYAKYPSFLMRGDYGWEEYNKNIDYKFYILDDVNFYEKKNYLNQLKAINSSVNDENRIRVLYAHKQVKSRPTMLLMNDKEWYKMRKDIFRSGSEEWWYKNMIVTHLNRRIYLTKEEMSLRNEAIKGIIEEEKEECEEVHEEEKEVQHDSKSPKSPKDEDVKPAIRKVRNMTKKDGISFRERIINWFNNNDLPLTDEQKEALAQSNEELSETEEDDVSMQEEDLRTMINDYGLKNEDNTDVLQKRTMGRLPPPESQRKTVEEWDSPDYEDEYYEEAYNQDMYDQVNEAYSHNFKGHPEDEIIYD